MKRIFRILLFRIAAGIWNVLEREPGKFHWEIVDLALEEARAAWTNSCHPSDAVLQTRIRSLVVPELGARRANKATDKRWRNLATGF